MRYIADVNQDPFVLEVYECECGFHIGLDSTYIEHVGHIEIECPNCLRKLDTEGVAHE